MSDGAKVTGAVKEHQDVRYIYETFFYHYMRKLAVHLFGSTVAGRLCMYVLRPNLSRSCARDFGAS